ncbi:MAG: hypothetical protein KDC26_04785 [Armatimonadetes bacterium]|nr:hypothetical protein [Armatimonadota bacterium]
MANSLELTPKLQQEIDRFRKYEKWRNPWMIRSNYFVLPVIILVSLFYSYRMIIVFPLMLLYLIPLSLETWASDKQDKIIDYFLLVCKEDTGFALSQIDDPINGDFGSQLYLKQTRSENYGSLVMQMPAGWRKSSIHVVSQQFDDFDDAMAVFRSYSIRCIDRGQIGFNFALGIAIAAFFIFFGLKIPPEILMWIYIVSGLAALIGLWGSISIPLSSRKHFQPEFNNAWQNLSPEAQEILKLHPATKSFLKHLN